MALAAHRRPGRPLGASRRRGAGRDLGRAAGCARRARARGAAAARARPRSRWRAARASGARCSACCAWSPRRRGGDLRLRALGGHAARARQRGARAAHGGRSWATGCGSARVVTALDVAPGGVHRDAAPAARRCARRPSSARCRSGRCATSRSPASPTRGWRACTASARRSPPRSSRPTRRRSGARRAPTGSRDGEGVGRLDLAAGARRALDARRARSGSAHFLAAPPARPPRGGARAAGATSTARTAREPDAYARARLGRRPASRRATSPSGRRAT